MMMVSMHTTHIIPSFHHFYMSFALQLHILSRCYLASHLLLHRHKIDGNGISIRNVYSAHMPIAWSTTIAILLSCALPPKRTHFALSLLFSVSLHRIRGPIHPIIVNNIFVFVQTKLPNTKRTTMIFNTIAQQLQHIVGSISFFSW